MVSTRRRTVQCVHTPRTKRKRQKVDSIEVYQTITQENQDESKVDDSLRVLRSMRSGNLDAMYIGRRPRLKRSTVSKEPVRCTDFGLYRKELYRENFFCHGCDLYDSLPLNMKKRVNRNGTRYYYTGRHSSRAFPTTKKRNYYSQYRGNSNHVRKMNQLLDGVESNTESESDSIDEGTTVDVTEEQSADVLPEIPIVVESDPIVDAKEMIVAFLTNFFLTFNQERGISIKKLCHLLIGIIFSSTIVGDVLKDAFLNRCQDYYWKNIFLPHNILKAIDLNGGILNYQGIELLRKVETQDVKYRRSLLPSRSTIQKYARKVELVGKNLVPYTMYQSIHGEGFRFDYHKMMSCLFESHNLLQPATNREIEVSSSMDGATLTKSLSFIGAGIKLIDIATKDPVTKEFINIPTSNKICKVQSRERCFPVEVLLSKDKKETYDIFQDFFTFMGNMATDESEAGSLVPRCKEIPTIQPIKLSSTGDLVGHQKCLNKGGGSATTDRPCFYCDCTRHNMHIPQQCLCQKYCEELHEDEQEWFCYHWPILTDEMIGEMQEKMDTLLESIESDSHLITDDTMVPDRLYFSILHALIVTRTTSTESIMM